MFKKAAAAFAIIAVASNLVSAEISFDTLNKTSLQQEISALDINVPSVVVAEDTGVTTRVDKEWTIMVFLNSKNNLEKYGLLDVNEMEKIGSSDKVNIVVEMGRINGYATNDGDWKTTRRFLIKKDNDFTKITSPVLADLGKTDMGDYKSLITFVKWAKMTYPAKKYALIVWNHGSGWDKSRGANVTKGISYDDETGNHITTPQLGLALKEVGGVDVYGSDACLMQMPEVTYEIKNYTKYIVGSEETEPGDGYTYDLFVGPVVAKPTMSAYELGKVAVDGYSDHYQQISQGSTQSLLDTSALDKFVTLTNDFVAATIAAGEKALVKTAASGAQSYAVYDNKDMGHFFDRYAATTANADVKAKALGLKAYIDGKLIVHNRVNEEFANGNSHGIAAYMPGYSFNSDYNALAWAGVSQWDELIKWYQAK
ncbi:MAG: clostripain-related cysteine peptidase [Elusimicrobiales bacterium]|nr:clostripain-related cysteine peptidase [Elusimicrobiales bacterium]